MNYGYILFFFSGIIIGHIAIVKQNNCIML